MTYVCCDFKDVEIGERLLTKQSDHYDTGFWQARRGRGLNQSNHAALREVKIELPGSQE